MSNLGFPYLYNDNHEKFQCHDCFQKSHPKYTFGSAILTIIIGALAFITALAWNDLARKMLDQMKDEENEIMSTLNYALLATSIAIVLGFLLMYYIEGERW